MSRSYKKIPVFGNCGHASRSSEKEDKQLANRYYRHWAKQELREWGEEALLPQKRQASDVWDFKHDGKFYRQTLWDWDLSIEYIINPRRNFRHDDKIFRKDYRPKDMRK